MEAPEHLQEYVDVIEILRKRGEDICMSCNPKLQNLQQIQVRMIVRHYGMNGFPNTKAVAKNNRLYLVVE